MKLNINLDTETGDVTLSSEAFRELVRKAAPKPTLTDQQAHDAMRAAARERAHFGTKPWRVIPELAEYERAWEPKIYTYGIKSHSNVHVQYRVLVVTDLVTGRITKVTCNCPDYQYKTARGVLGHVCKHGIDAQQQHISFGHLGW